MMKRTVFCKAGKLGFTDPCYCYALIAAVLAFLYMLFPSYTQALYENCLILPCMMFLGALQERRKKPENRKIFILSGAMVVWFLFLQGKRSVEHTDIDNIGLFLTVYLFAFPLASLLQDGDRKKVLKIFAEAYLAAAALLSAEGLLLILNCLPDFLSEHVFWDGSRLHVFWHPNIVACFWMIGIVFCTTFLAQAESYWLKLGLSALLVLMLVTLALTNCRTAIILTGGYLGAMMSFRLIKHGWKWFVPGVIVVLMITAAFYMGARRLNEANHDALINKYAQQYLEQVAPESTESMLSETDVVLKETAEPETWNTTEVAESAEAVPGLEEQKTEAAEMSAEEEYDEESLKETIPITMDPDTGEIYLTTVSPQGSIENDFGSLNSRTYIWSAAKFAIREAPSILYWGMHNPGWYVSYYNFFPIAHLHNAWMECLVGMGLVGFLIAMIFTLITIWNCLIILLKYHQDIWKRNVALLVLCLMVAAILEPYLFYTTIDYHLTDLLFFLCIGYLVHWQEEDNRYFWSVIRRKVPFLNK